MKPLYLGINIDHVATLRNARGGVHPSPLRAALAVVESQADIITAHLREDRRHIRDQDIKDLKDKIPLPLNLEMAATEEMLAIALHHRPESCCLVPERREELTTEGGLDILSQRDTLRPVIESLTSAGIKVSLFLDPYLRHLDVAKSLGVSAVELHTGSYCNAIGRDSRHKSLHALTIAAKYAQNLNLECHAGHGLSFDTVTTIAAIPQITVLNIGHFIIGEALFCGLKEAVTRMRQKITQARTLNP